MTLRALIGGLVCIAAMAGVLAAASASEGTAAYDWFLPLTAFTWFAAAPLVAVALFHRNVGNTFAATIAYACVVGVVLGIAAGVTDGGDAAERFAIGTIYGMSVALASGLLLAGCYAGARVLLGPAEEA
jgi:hypothetical protein